MRRVLLVLVMVGIGLAFAGGCGLRAVRTPPLPDSRADEARGLLPLGNCQMTAEYVVTESLAQLVTNSTWVVDGVMDGMTGTRNLSRDPGQVVEGVDFRVKVKQYWKGEGPDTLTISLVRSARSPGEERACRDTHYQEPAAGTRWILFLKPSSEFSDLAAPAGYPWRYAVAEGGATPDMPGGTHPAFPAMTVIQLHEAVRK